MISNHQTDKDAAAYIKLLFAKHTAEHHNEADKREYGKFNFAVDMQSKYGATEFESGILFETLMGV